MTITPEGYKLLMDDPRKFRHNDRNAVKNSRPVIEELILFYLFNPDKVNDNFIEEVKAPASSLTTKFLKTYVDKINTHLLYEGTINNDQLENYVSITAEEYKFSVEHAKEKLGKYSEYVQFLMIKPNKTTVTKAVINDSMKMATELEIKYGSILRCGQYERKTNTSLQGNQIYTTLKHFQSFPDYAVDKGTYLFRQNILVWHEDYHTLVIPVDIINQTSEKKIDVFNIRVIDYSIKDIKSKNDFWFEVGLQKYILDAFFGYETNQHLLVIDPKGYTSLVTISPTTSDEYKTAFTKANENIKRICQSKFFETYQGFESGTIKL